MDFQYPPAVETKVFRCTCGASIVDLRPESATFLHHVSVDSTATSYRALNVAGRFPHGYLKPEHHTEATYIAGAFY